MKQGSGSPSWTTSRPIKAHGGETQPPPSSHLMAVKPDHGGETRPPPMDLGFKATNHHPLIPFSKSICW
ncbi:hypothetical protein Hanom_Chr11g01003251 [Helianthus anomalus]